MRNVERERKIRTVAEYLRKGRLRGRCPRRDETQIDHLGIAVRSIEQALKFYQDQLGLSVAARETVKQEKVHVAMLPLNGSRIELLEPTEADSPVGRFLDKRGEGLHHVALKVPDLAAAVERLRASGARLLNEPRAAPAAISTFSCTRLHGRSASGINSRHETNHRNYRRQRIVFDARI